MLRISCHLMPETKRKLDATCIIRSISFRIATSRRAEKREENVSENEMQIFIEISILLESKENCAMVSDIGGIIFCENLKLKLNA